MAGTSGKQIDEAVAEKKFMSVKGSQESIQMLSMWVLHHKAQHDKIVSLWLAAVKKCKLPQRLTLFYVCNEVVQTCKRKHAVMYKDSFKEILPEATILVRDSTVRGSVERIFKIWEERGVYDNNFVEELITILSVTLTAFLPNYSTYDSKVRPSFALKMLAEFKPVTLREKISQFCDLEKENEAKRRRISVVNLDFINKNYTKIMKDRSHGRQHTMQVEEAHKSLDQLVTGLQQETKERERLLELLDQSELFYEAQYGEARIVANAYKNFGTRVHNLRRKLVDVRKTLPDPLSPLPSPPQEDVPSPTASPPPQNTTDNCETIDMDLSDTEGDSLDKAQHDRQLQELLKQREQLQKQLAQFNVKGSGLQAAIANDRPAESTYIPSMAANMPSAAASVNQFDTRVEGNVRLGVGAGGYSPTKVSQGSASPPGPSFSPLSSPHKDKEWTWKPEGRMFGGRSSPPLPSRSSPPLMINPQISSFLPSYNNQSINQSINDEDDDSQTMPGTLSPPTFSGGSFEAMQAVSSKLGLMLPGLASSTPSVHNSSPSRCSVPEEKNSNHGSVKEDSQDSQEPRVPNMSFLSSFLAGFSQGGPALPGLAEGLDESEDGSNVGDSTPVMDEQPTVLAAQKSSGVAAISAAVTGNLHSTVDPIDLLNRLLNRNPAAPNGHSTNHPVPITTTSNAQVAVSRPVTSSALIQPPALRPPGSSTISLVQYEGSEDCVSPPRVPRFSLPSPGLLPSQQPMLQTQLRPQPPLAPPDLSRLLTPLPHGLTPSQPHRPLSYPSNLLSPTATFPQTRLLGFQADTLPLLQSPGGLNPLLPTSGFMQTNIYRPAASTAQNSYEYSPPVEQGFRSLGDFPPRPPSPPHFQVAPPLPPGEAPGLLDPPPLPPLPPPNLPPLPQGRSLLPPLPHNPSAWRGEAQLGPRGPDHQPRGWFNDSPVRANFNNDRHLLNQSELNDSDRQSVIGRLHEPMNAVRRNFNQLECNGRFDAERRASFDEQVDRENNREFSDRGDGRVLFDGGIRPPMSDNGPLDGFNGIGSQRPNLEERHLGPRPQFRGQSPPRMRLPPPPKLKEFGDFDSPKPPGPHDNWGDGPEMSPRLRGPRPGHPRGPMPQDMRPRGVRPLFSVSARPTPPSNIRMGGRGPRGPRMFGSPRF